MRHMAAVLARQSDQCSFDKRPDTDDLPQSRLAPRHEPILDGFCVFHDWTVLLRANYCNKKSACDNIFFRSRIPAAVQAAFQPGNKRLLEKRRHAGTGNVVGAESVRFCRRKADFQGSRTRTRTRTTRRRFLSSTPFRKDPHTSLHPPAGATASIF